MNYNPILDGKIREMIAEEEKIGRYRVNEIFSSVQGEGFWVGVPATFIRLQGCPVGCHWCDTKYTWPTEAAQGKKLGESMTYEEIATKIQHPHIIITGGEPTMWDLDDLIDAVRNTNAGMENFVQIESSGLSGFRGNLIPDWVTWSPKANINFDGPEDFKMFVDEVKFVVDDALAFSNVEGLLDWYRNYKTQRLVFSTLTFMAEGCPPSPESLKRAMAFANEFNGYPKRVMVSDRIQYRAEVR